MAKINILDSNVFNRIAAGEVVDRPFSVVKEFVENSLDAGAKNISIQIERGGKDRVCVSDDGSGIEKSELPSAFLPHATSKIACVDDLDHIRTLGFRGEALASIASVSNMRIRSKAQSAAEAFELCCDGGIMGQVQPCALGIGTEISAENLFFNTPVRAKFLKTDKGEEGEITNFVSRFILGNPNVAFRYTVDGKLSLQSFGGGLDEAVSAVYGSDAVQDCYKIDATKHGIRVYGYLGKPSFAKANRTYQSVFVNGRYVVNQTIGSAISNAYASYLMKRQYPFYVLFVDVPAEAVDVNVHPNKSDVRFENNQVIYGSIYSIVSAVLDGNAAALDFIVGAKESNNESSLSGRGFAEAEKGAESKESDLTNETTVVSKNSFENINLNSILPNINTEKKGLASPRSFVFHDSRKDEVSRPAAPAEDVFTENKRYLEEIAQKAKQQKIVCDHAEYKGCLFNTYLLYEFGDAVYMIDQHAAHERLIFDCLKEKMDARKVIRQPMLLPYTLQVNSEEFTFLSEHIEELNEIGFEIEIFGAMSFKISAVPMDLQDIDLGAFFLFLFAEIGVLRAIRLSDLLRDRIAMTACKHAIKGGMVLTDLEKQRLFEQLAGDMGLRCPHGRPVAVRVTKTEIEKMFKRIL